MSMLEWATKYFKEKQVKNPRLSIEWLLAHVLAVKRLDVYLMHERPLARHELDTLRPLVRRRAQHEPLQYILGETDFLNARIKVSPGVLIPRQETEQLTDLVLTQFATVTNQVVFDIGTGTGCIPVAIKLNKPGWHVLACDISDEALSQARANATLNEVDIEYFSGNLFDRSDWPTLPAIDCIISNPPYILPEEKNTLDVEVSAFEPELALFCNTTEQMYRALCLIGLDLLQPGGHIFLELHEHHAHEVLALFSTVSWKAKIVRDFDGKPRFLTAKRI